MSQVVESYTGLIHAFQNDVSNLKWTEETQKRYKVEVDKILFEKDKKNEMKTNDIMNEMINKINEVVANIMDKRYERFTKHVDHFKSLYGEKKDDEEEENNEKNDDEEQNLTRKVEKVIGSLEDNKMPGEDKLVYEVWKYGGQKITKRLTELIYKVRKGKGFPDRWRVGIIAPELKDKPDTVEHPEKSYRGITLLNTAYKIYAIILASELQDEIVTNELLPNTQFAYQMDRSKRDIIFILNYVITRELYENNGNIFAFFLDLSAAFDNVNRKELENVMKEKQISEELRKSINEIQQKTISKVVVDGKMSDEFQTTKGLRQGCPLSPLLFLLYTAGLKDILKQFEEIKIGSERIQFLAYSDDIILLAKNPKTLKNMMKETKSFLDKKEAKINLKKSKILIFEKDGDKKVGKTEYKWNWGDEDLEEVKDYKYLGFQFRKNGKSEEIMKSEEQRRDTKEGSDSVEQINNNLSTNSDTDDFAIWEFGKTREMDNITNDYLKRILDNIKRDETSRRRKQNKIVKECWEELKEKNKNDLQKWEKCKHLYYKTKGIDIEILELIIEEIPNLKQDLLRKRKTEQEQGHK